MFRWQWRVNCQCPEITWQCVLLGSISSFLSKASQENPPASMKTAEYRYHSLGSAKGWQNRAKRGDGGGIISNSFLKKIKECSCSYFNTKVKWALIIQYWASSEIVIAENDQNAAVSSHANEVRWTFQDLQHQ